MPASAPALIRPGNSLRLTDWFCGAGGATQGATAVPWVEPVMAANHDATCIATHSTNFPDVEHHQGDIQDLDVSGHPYAEIFWASPECTNWSQAKGEPVDFDKHPGLFDDPQVAEDVKRSRALMQDVVRYLEGMALRQQPVLAGVVENVVDIRKWNLWHVWLGRIKKLGYRIRLIAYNSMHAEPQRTPRAPQSRDRLYLAYWHVSLGRDPDWNRWLRPRAWCPTCDETVSAIQVFKKPGADMGRYGKHGQYVYRCPRVPCRGQIVEPTFLPAAAAIDWTLPGERIGDRDKPLSPKTMARIVAGLRKYARPFALEAAGHTFERRPGVRTRPLDRPLTTQHTTAGKAIAVPPMLVPAGGTWRDSGQPVDEPMATRTTTENDGLLVPPMTVLVTRPEDDRPGNRAQAVSETLWTQTVRAETGLLVPPFLAELRGDPSTHPDTARSVGEDAMGTVTAGGNHHGLTVASLTMQAWAAIYAYDTGRLRDHRREPLPTQTAIEGDGLLSGLGLPSVEDCLFRMLEPHEIHAAMAFTPDYIVLGSKRKRVEQLGNAVTPPVAEILISALVECITGEDLTLAA